MHCFSVIFITNHLISDNLSNFELKSHSKIKRAIPEEKIKVGRADMAGQGRRGSKEEVKNFKVQDKDSKRWWFY